MNQATETGAVEQHETPLPKAGPGAQLTEQREARSWTVEQVATQLNLAPRQIYALEADNFAALPGMASVRGFIRSYAKLLKIEAEPLLATIPSEPVVNSIEPVQMRRALSAPFFDDTRLPSMSGGSSPSKTTLIGIALLALAASLFIAHKMDWIPSSPETAVAKKDESVSASATSMSIAPAQEVTVAEVAKPASPEPTSNESVASKPAVVEPAAAQVAAAVPIAKPVAEPIQSALKPAAPPANVAAVPSNGALVFKLRGDSWVEVKRVNAKGPESILASRVMKAGTTETLAVNEPVSVVIGNAAVVDVSLRGEPVDTKADVKSNVARLNLK